MLVKRLWKVTGSRRNKDYTVKIRAFDHNEAVRKGSMDHLLVVTSCVLVTSNVN